MATWKKWLVWNSNRWEVDEGNSMIHEKCLATIRGIHKEVLGDNIEQTMFILFRSGANGKPLF